MLRNLAYFDISTFRSGTFLHANILQAPLQENGAKRGHSSLLIPIASGNPRITPYNFDPKLGKRHRKDVLQQLRSDTSYKIQ